MLHAGNHMCPSSPIELVFERFARAGIGGFDLYLPHIPHLKQPSNDPHPEYFRRNLLNCREAAESAGVPITGIIGVPTPEGKSMGSYLAADAEQGRADALACIRHNVEVAATLGATRICSAEGVCPQGADPDAIWDRLYHMLRESAPICESRGVTLELEPHPGYLMAGDFQRARELIEAVGSPAIRICLDFCHANVITRGRPAAMIEALAGVIGTVHLADGIQANSLHLPIGRGEIDVDGCIRAVKRTGFAGAWALCMYGCAFPELCIRTAVDFLRKKHADIVECRR